MTGKILGYIRVSSGDQNTARQLENIKLDKVFTDYASGGSTNRPALINLLQFAREYDILIVHSMDRLARNLDDLRKIVKELTDKQVIVQFVTENLIFSSTDNPISTLLLSVMGAFAEFERAIIRERQREGIAIAKQKGVYKGRKPRLNNNHLAIIQTKLSKGTSKSAIARELNISRQTLYQFIDKIPLVKQ